ncbi:MAG TPA: response regulator transcription factor [Cellulomonas sp.]
MTPITRVGLVEDELLLRRMLEQLLHGREGLTLVHSVGGFQEAKLAITPRSTDVAVVDVNLEDGDGVQLGIYLQRVDPEIGILLLSSEDAMASFMAAQDEASKPWSYLSKRSSFATTTLVRAIHGAAHGEQVIDPYLVDRSTPRTGSELSRLSPAQLRVLTLVAQGYSNDAIAQELHLAVRSVENHLLAIYRVLGVRADGRNPRVAATLRFLGQTSRQPAR